MYLTSLCSKPSICAYCYFVLFFLANIIFISIESNFEGKKVLVEWSNGC